MRGLSKVAIGVAAVASSLTVLVMVVNVLNPGPGASQLASLKVQVEPLLQAIESHKAMQGRYPDSLADAGLSPPSTRYGDWQYHRNEDGRGFGLSVGDYGKYLFVLWWDSTSGQWFLDE